MQNTQRNFLVAALLTLAGIPLGAQQGLRTAHLRSEVVYEAEPNDIAANAKLLTVGQHGIGALSTNTDLDFWSVELTEGHIVRIEVASDRFDVDWLSYPRPRVTLIAPDGTTPLIHSHNLSDGTIARYRVPATGTYFVLVDLTPTQWPGFEYAVGIQQLYLPDLRAELELPGGNTNDSMATAEYLEPGTLYANLGNDDPTGDTDWFTFQFDATSRARFEIYGVRNGANTPNGVPSQWMHLLDASGNPIHVYPAGHVGDPGFEAYLEPGTYFLCVDEAHEQSSRDYYLDFELTTMPSAEIELEPNDDAGTANPIQYGSFFEGYGGAAAAEDWYRFEGDAGDVIHLYELWYDAPAFVQFYDDQGAELPAAYPEMGVSAYRTFLPETGTFWIRISAWGGYGFQLELFERTRFESEPNDAPALAERLDVNRRAAGVVDGQNDRDLIAFQARGATLETFTFDSRHVSTHPLSGFGSTLMPIIRILDKDGQVLAEFDSDSPGGTPTDPSDPMAAMAITFLVPATDTYYVEILGSYPGSTGAYVLERR